MLPGFTLQRIFPTTHADAPAASQANPTSLKETIKSAVTVRETELTRWRRTFDTHAKEVEGQKCVPVI
jgi:solute carrier family 25 (mitochondrial aspartate/glutamate transporter), member 12/13